MQKAIEIGECDGIKIMYKNSEFCATVEDTEIKCETEHKLKNQIYSHFAKIKEAKEDKIKKAEFEVTIKAIHLKKLFKFLKEIFGELQIQFDKNEARIIQMDPANVAMVRVTLKKEIFEKYKSNNSIIYLDTNTFYNSIKNIDDNTSITLSKNNGNVTILSKGDLTHKYSLNIEDFDIGNHKFPSLEHDTIFNMNSNQLNKIITSLSSVCDSFLIDCNDKNINFVSVEDKNHFEIMMLNKTKLKKSKSKYSIEYMIKLKNLKYIFKELKIKISNDYPLLIECESKGISLDFILAPRVTND